MLCKLYSITGNHKKGGEPEYLLVPVSSGRTLVASTNTTRSFHFLSDSVLWPVQKNIVYRTGWNHEFQVGQGDCPTTIALPNTRHSELSALSLVSSGVLVPRSAGEGLTREDQT
jgi:hypothetical protein